MQDILWKEIVGDLFEDFAKFFFSDLYSHIDFTKGYEFLDKEMANILRKTRKGRKFADRLVKVFLKNGKEKWILIHIEIQSYIEEEFSKRMFTYFYRIFDRYQKEITAIAIFIDKNPYYKPEKFEYNFFGTKLTYEYRTYKILDQNEKELVKKENPFALVVLAGLYTIKTIGKSRSKIDERYLFKTNLVKLLLEKGYIQEKIDKLFFFIDEIMKLPESLEIKFSKEIETTLGGENKMNIAPEKTLSYRIGKIEGEKKGKIEGEKKGKIEGEKKGKIEGEKKGKIEVAKNLLKLGVSVSVIAKATGLSEKEISKLKNKSNKQRIES
jgi:predicted transposase/invertase (TIGR01784 family)